MFMDHTVVYGLTTVSGFEPRVLNVLGFSPKLEEREGTTAAGLVPPRSVFLHVEPNAFGCPGLADELYNFSGASGRPDT